MKKTIYVTMIMVFALALGFAQAGERTLNGVDTGKSYDLFEIEPIYSENTIENASAGGVRAGDRELYNGITDFSGRSYDLFEIGGAGAGVVNSVESSSAGGKRAETTGTKPSRLDFGTGRSYDTIPMNPGLGW